MTGRDEGQTLTQRTAFYGSFVLLALALFYLLQKSVFSSDEPSDYQFIWLAGDMWRSGLNPYSDVYFSLGEERFVGLHPPKVWFYPPNWWPVAWASSATSFETGLLLWRGLSALCLGAGIFAVVHAFQRHVGRIGILRINSALIFACLMSATPIAMALGQTSFLSFLGLSLFLAAFLSDRKILMVAGISLLMLKPQIGLPFCFFLLANRRWISTLVIAAIVSIAAAFPAFLYVSPASFIENYVSQFSFHNEMLPNHPRAMTGVRNLGYDLFGVWISTLQLTLTASVFAFLLGLLSGLPGKTRAIELGFLLVLVVLIVPLHTYDMMLLVPLIVLVARMGWIYQGIVFLGLILVFRANNLAKVTGFFDHSTTHFEGSRITSIGLLIIFTGLLIACAELFNRRQRTETLA